VADRVPGRAGSIVSGKHTLYRVALLIGLFDGSLVDRIRARI
jgi:hypothetical protein